MGHICTPFGRVVAAAIFRNDVVVIREGCQRGPCPSPDVERGKITELSKKSRKRLAFIALNADNNWRSMATLTYPSDFPGDGVVVKRHLRLQIAAMKRLLPGLAYLWYLEFQKRGAPHIHLLLSEGLPKKRDARKACREWLSVRWYEIVGSEDPKHLLAGTRWEDTRSQEGLRRYTVKYALKPFQKKVPEMFQNVGRFWGHGRNVTCTPKDIILLNEQELLKRLEKWSHIEHIRDFVPKTLYNAAQCM